MELSVAVKLIKAGVTETSQSQVWSDWGAGEGLFSMALSSLLAPGSVIYVVDKQNVPFRKAIIGEPVTFISLKKDFVTQDTGLSNLDGLIMANSLHFVQDKTDLLIRVKKLLREAGRLIVVEYDMDVPSRWVPYPVKSDSLAKIASAAGFGSYIKLDEAPSIYHKGMIYSGLIC